MKTLVYSVSVLGQSEPVVIQDEKGQLKRKLLEKLLAGMYDGRHLVVPDVGTVELLAEVLDENKKLRREIAKHKNEIREEAEEYYELKQRFDRLNRLFYDTLLCNNREDIAISCDRDGCVKVMKLSEVPFPTDKCVTYKVVLANQRVEGATECVPRPYGAEY